MRLFAALVLATCLLAAHEARAVPVEWTLVNWGTTASESVTGSFVYDADFGTFSNVLVSDSLGNSFLFVGVNADATQLEFVTGDPTSTNLTNEPVALGVMGNPGMTNAGGDIFILTAGGTQPLSSLSLCSNADCSSAGSPDFLTSGKITGVVAPEPATMWLLGMGLLGVAPWARRRAS